MSLRSTAKHLLAVAAANSGALGALRVLRGPVVRILCFHRVVEDLDEAARRCMRPLSVSRTTFTALLDHLQRRYEVWPLARAAEAIAAERPMPPRDVAVLTFDDGYLDVLTRAAPLIRERGLPATVFVTTEVAGAAGAARHLLHDRMYALVRRAAAAGVRLVGLVDAVWPLARADAALLAGDPMAATDAILLGLPRAQAQVVADALAARLGEPAEHELPPCLGWDEIAELARMGFEVGAHTATHATLPLEDDAGLERELAGARAEIGRRVGVAPVSLAYPAGRYDLRIMTAAHDAGFEVALTTEDRPNSPGDDLLCLGRKGLSEAHGRGPSGRVSPALIGAHVGGLFATLGLSRPQPGSRVMEAPWNA